MRFTKDERCKSFTVKILIFTQKVLYFVDPIGLKLERRYNLRYIITNLIIFFNSANVVCKCQKYKKKYNYTQIHGFTALVRDLFFLFSQLF